MEKPTTIIPGMNAKHAVITADCRKMHGDDGALDVAFGRLRREYLECISARRSSGQLDGVSFHVALTVEA